MGVLYFTFSLLLRVIPEANPVLLEPSTSSDLAFAPRLELGAGLIPGSSEGSLPAFLSGIRLPPLKAKLQYWSYVEY